jgi:hypothetical protein
MVSKAQAAPGPGSRPARDLSPVVPPREPRRREVRRDTQPMQSRSRPTRRIRRCSTALRASPDRPQHHSWRGRTPPCTRASDRHRARLEESPLSPALPATKDRGSTPSPLPASGCCRLDRAFPRIQRGTSLDQQRRPQPGTAPRARTAGTRPHRRPGALPGGPPVRCGTAWRDRLLASDSAFCGSEAFHPPSRKSSHPPMSGGTRAACLVLLGGCRARRR